MKIAAVIAEYNPLHEGHQYHMEQTRKITGADYIITIMSGDFVQRGLPAVEEKFQRARKALQAGSDLVLELPLPYALSSARGFAFGGVSLAQGLGCVDYLSFGLEDERDLDAMKALAHTSKPASYNIALKRALKEGESYPAAIARAVSETCPELDTGFLTQKHNSNTLLALEYLQALYCLNSPIQPVAVKRQGMSYLSEFDSVFSPADCALPVGSVKNVASSGTADDETSRADCYPSATALRARLQKSEPSNSVLLFPKDFSTLLHYKLLSCDYENLLQYREMTPQLAHKILNALPSFENYEQFANLLWTRDTTYARICRTLSGILLDIKKDTWDVHAQVPYARILGFRMAAAPLLHQISESAVIPVISKLADAPAVLPAQAQRLLKLEVKAGQIYDSVRYHKSGEKLPGEFQKRIIII